MKLDSWLALISTWFHLGKIPRAPGTFGTLGAIPLVVLLALFGPLSYLGISLVFTVFAVFVASAHEARIGVHDSKEIVIDEVAGFVITMAWLPLTWQSLLLGFLLFRLLDVVKPFPIGWLDKKIDGGLGVVADDVAAGVIANVVLQVVYTQTNWLGAQYGVL